MRRPDVLVIEDESVVVEAARRLLEPEGLTVDAVPDGDRARARLRERSYRAVLLDLMLPGVTGLELLELARRLRPAMPVVVVTGYASPAKAAEALAAGAFDFLPKPFDLDELLGVVHRALRPSATAASAGCRGPVHHLGRSSWAQLESAGSARLGAAPGFVAAGGEIRQVRLPEPGDELVQGGELARLVDEAGRVHLVWAPLGGTVLNLNGPVRTLGARLRHDPCGDGWLARIAPFDLERELGLLNETFDAGAEP